MASTSEQLTPAYKLQRDVQELLRREVEQAKEAVIQQALKDFEARIRKVAGQTAIMISNYYSVERMGADLVIRVKIENDKP